LNLLSCIALVLWERKLYLLLVTFVTSALAIERNNGNKFLASLVETYVPIQGNYALKTLVHFIFVIFLFFILIFLTIL